MSENNNINDNEFNEIFFEMMDANDRISFERLREYQIKHPGYARKLIEAYADWLEFREFLGEKII